jgi:hypothetical protein
MRKRIVRPEADSKKINSKDEFELCYLRHRYFRRVSFNPTIKDMEPYQRIAIKLATKSFFTYRPLLILVGLEKEDLINIANVHLVSFLGLFSLEKMPTKYEEFVKTFSRYQSQAPKKDDLLDKNKANFTLFLKQRMEDLIRICRQKAKNIKGFSVEGFFYCYGPKLPSKNSQDLVKNYERLGFKKLDASVYKSIKKRAEVFDNSPFIFGNNYYIAIPLPNKTLSVVDLDGADVSPRGTLHNMNPEELFFTLEEQNIWDKRQEEFNKKSSIDKAEMIKKFIDNNKSKRVLREEIQIARKILKELE